MPRRGVSQERLLKWIKLLTEISIELDHQLIVQYVGDYEVPAMYLDWKESPESYEKTLGITLQGVKKSHEQRFQNFASAALDKPLGTLYVRGMERYISRL